MAEESKGKSSSQQGASEEEKKPTAVPAPAPKPAPPPSAPAAVPRPPVQAPKPQVPPPPASRQAPKETGRRNLVKAIFALSAILAIVPFVPWGRFLTSSVPTGSAKRTLLQKAVVDDLSRFGAAAGKAVNVNDLSTFPANGHWIITYPSSGDLTLDAQNPDTFLKYELIRLPESLGGASKQATDFVAFSKVCVHLWCSPNYNPKSGHEQYECPCHGSIYRVPDGKAVDGPASFQAPPTNAIPMLTLQADKDGNLYVFYPNRDPSKPYPNDQVGSIEANGDLGYGRDFNSYQNFIKPSGQMAADTSGLNQEVTS